MIAIRSFGEHAFSAVLAGVAESPGEVLGLDVAAHVGDGFVAHF